MTRTVRTAAFCGVDLGTQGARAVIVDADGTRLGSGESAVRSHRGAGRHEQDPRQWWDALCAATRTAIHESGAHVVAVALDATSGTILVEDPDGAHRGPALMYDDARAGDQAQRIQHVGERLWDALGYRMQPTWALPKVLWLLEMGHIGARDTIAHQSDHLVRRLVGHAVATDTSHALKTGVDLRTAAWPVDVFDELAVPTRMLPDVVVPGTPFGVVCADAASQTGLPAGATVHAGMTDGCAAQIASAAVRPGSWSSALGTTLVVKGATTDLLHDRTGAVYSHRHPDGGWLPGGASSTGAGVLAQRFAAHDFDELTRRAARVAPVAAVTYPLAGQGERFPFVAADAAGFGDDVAADDGTRFAALCQGIAYVELLAYDVLSGLGAATDGTVSLTGGAARNEWWNQLRTDVLQRPTRVPASADAATGMAILASVDDDTLADTAERMVRIEREYRPDAERGAALRSGYAELVDALADRGWLDPSVATLVMEHA